MSRVSYVNGRYLPHAHASVHVEDRGYQFADGVYEVIAVRDGAVLDLYPHLLRLDRSLRELRIAKPMEHWPLGAIVREVVRRNRVGEGIVYIQVTRGVAKRAHAFPKHVAPALVVTARNLAPPSQAARAGGVHVMTAPDIRWGRCDIKSIALLPNVLARQAAAESGVFEAWLIDADGMVTEGTASNAWIVDAKRNLVTRDLGHAILGGITRAALLDACRGAKVKVVERAFSLAEAHTAREAMMSSTTAFVLPIVAIDGRAVGDGAPGPVYRLLLDLYHRHLNAPPRTNSEAKQKPAGGDRRPLSKARASA